MSAPEPEILRGRGQPCVWCGAPSEGRYTCPVEGDARGVALPLCDAHGRAERPSIFEVWARLRERRAA